VFCNSVSSAFIRAASSVARFDVVGLLKAALVAVIAVPRKEAMSNGVQGGGGRGTACC
jgi:hypothetical protein